MKDADHISNFSRTEQSEINQILARQAAEMKLTIFYGLNDLIGDWESFVARVEQGYDFTIYDYTNDLYRRNYIEEILNKTSHSTAEKIRRIVHPLDVRFNAATRCIPRPLESDEYKNLGWWSRIPKRLVGELKSDLQHLDITP